MKRGALLMLTLRGWRVYQEPSLKGLDNLVVALVRATTYEHRQSHGEGVFEYIERIRLRLVSIP
jgi:hypothetical protein